MNAKDEFLRHIADREVLCAGVSLSDRSDGRTSGTTVDLTTGWDKSDWDNFLKGIDHEYDNGFGGQELHGTIWYKDGTWSTRGEYDGSEWWEYHKCPPIDDRLNRVDKVRDQKINKIL
jgi:hypothetical protein